MKKFLIFTLLMTSTCFFVYSQSKDIIHLSFNIEKEKEVVYLMFDPGSTEICNIPKEQQGRYHGIEKAKKYEKIRQKDGRIDFYICRELFQLDKLKKIDTCLTEQVINIKFSEIEDLIEKVNRENYLYPSTLFDKIYIFEKISDDQIAKYKVKWRYYIE